MVSNSGNQEKKNISISEDGADIGGVWKVENCWSKFCFCLLFSPLLFFFSFQPSKILTFLMFKVPRGFVNSTEPILPGTETFYFMQLLFVGRAGFRVTVIATSKVG